MPSLAANRLGPCRRRSQPGWIPAIFRLPVDRIRAGYYSDAYFVLTKSLLEAEGEHPHVTMQVFQKEDSVLGGIDEAIAILKTCSGHAGNGEWVLRLGSARGPRAAARATGSRRGRR